MCDSFIIAYLSSKDASQIARGISIVEGKLSESNQFQPEDAVQIFPLLIPLLMHMHYKIRKNSFYLFLSVLNRFSDYLDSACDSVPNCLASLICVDEEISECAHQALEFIFDLDDPKYWWPYCEKVLFNSKSNPQRIKLMFIIYSHFDEIPVLPIIKLLDDPIFTIQKMAYSMLQFNDQEMIQNKLEKYRSQLGIEVNPYELDMNQRQIERYLQLQETIKAQQTQKNPARIVRRTRRTRASDNLVETRRQAAEDTIIDEMTTQGEKAAQFANDHKVHSRFVSKMNTTSPVGKRTKGSYPSYDNYQISQNLMLNPQLNIDPNPDLIQNPNFYGNQNEMDNQNYNNDDFYGASQQSFNNNSNNMQYNQQFQSYNQSPTRNGYNNNNCNNYDNSNAKIRNSFSSNNQNRSPQQADRLFNSPGQSRRLNSTLPANDNQDRYPVEMQMNSQQRNNNNFNGNNNNFGNNSNNCLFNRSNNNSNNFFGRSNNNANNNNNNNSSNRSSNNANYNSNFVNSTNNNGLFNRSGNNQANNSLFNRSGNNANNNNSNNNNMFNRSYNSNANNNGLFNRTSVNDQSNNGLFSRSSNNTLNNNMNNRFNDNQSNRNLNNMNNRFNGNQSNRNANMMNMAGNRLNNNQNNNMMGNRFNNNQNNSMGMNSRYNDNQSNRNSNMMGMSNRFNNNNQNNNMMNNRFTDNQSNKSNNMNSMGMNNRFNNNNQNNRNNNMMNMNNRFNDNQGNNNKGYNNNNQNFRNNGYGNMNNYDYIGNNDGISDGMFDQMYPMNPNSSAMFDKDSVYDGILQQLGNKLNLNDTPNNRSRKVSSTGNSNQTLGNNSPSSTGDPLPFELVDLKEKDWMYRRDYLDMIHKTLSSKQKHYNYRHDYLMDCVMDASNPPNKRVAASLSKVITDIILEDPGVIEPFLDEITNFMIQSVSQFNSIYRVVPTPPQKRSPKPTKSTNKSENSSSTNTPRASKSDNVSVTSNTINSPQNAKSGAASKGGKSTTTTPKATKANKRQKIDEEEEEEPEEIENTKTPSKKSVSSRSQTPSRTSTVFNIPTSPSKTAKVVLVSKTPNSTKSKKTQSVTSKSGKTNKSIDNSSTKMSERLVPSLESSYDASAFDDLIEAIILEVNPSKLINSMLDYPNRTTAHVELLIQKIYKRRPNLTLCRNDLEKLLTFLVCDAYPLAIKLGSIANNDRTQPAYLDAVIYLLHKTSKNQPKIYESITSLTNHEGMAEILSKFLPKEEELYDKSGTQNTLRSTYNSNSNSNKNTSRNETTNDYENDLNMPPMYILLRELKKSDDCSIDLLADCFDSVSFNSMQHLLKVFLRFLALLSRLSEKKIKDNENDIKRICSSHFNYADLLSILSLRKVESEIVIGLSKYIWFAPKEVLSGADTYYENMYRLFTKSAGQERNAIIIIASGIQKVTGKSILDLSSIAEPHQKVIEKLLSQYENQNRE